MVAKELWSVARDKKSLPVVKITYLSLGHTVTFRPLRFTTLQMATF